MSVALVTDSTAGIASAVAAGCGVTVVPLQVLIGEECYDEGAPEVTPAAVAEALRSRRKATTSRAAPTVFAETYQRLADQGATEVLSIHLSRDVSATLESAQLAARDAPVPVTTVDTRQIGPAVGYAVRSAADVLAAGGDVAAAADAAERRAGATASLFYVDTLEYLRRGGRVGSAARFLAGALAVKPLLEISDGAITPREKVRTSSKAIARLEELAVEAAGEAQVEVCVAHLTSPERAARLAERVADRLEEQLGGRDVWCTELGGVLGAHVGPGMLAVCVAPLL